LLSNNKAVSFPRSIRDTHTQINGANYGEVIAAPSHDETSDAPVMMFGGNDGSPLVARSILKKIANHNVEVHKTHSNLHMSSLAQD
jgi:hypothetical protein